MKMGNKELKLFILFLFVFFLFYFVPLHHVRWQYAILEGLFLVQEYAREHILFCLVPALFIAGAISCFVSQTAVLKRIFHIRTSPILIVSTEHYFLFLKLFSFFLVATCVSR
ncbi:MAG: hypothetical protein KIIPBIDF_00954 [Candidatus Methanoperedenaceae archaeon GB50]|nr:MAG: hypothetical protein KIIPBIDF_00954 [Candidatus Methanoperedenaceae archaeon GB50]